jgi:hypothetical protein
MELEALLCLLFLFNCPVPFRSSPCLFSLNPVVHRQ